jgi:upstream activation factor subunit UAF30
MPKKAAQSKTSKSKSTKTKSTTQSKSKSTPKKDLPKVEEEVSLTEEVSDVEQDVEQDLSSSDDKKKRRHPTKDTVSEDFNELVACIDEEIQRLRQSSGKTKGVKFLRTLNKRVKTLRTHSNRVMKQKHKTNRKNNTNSGFLKPVQISKEMAKFTGWDSSELRSRVDVTKYICKYIRDNNLQNPEDRRQILADKKLSKLLDYDSTSDDKPLTYYRIQSYMKRHFTNPK